ncbi:MAG: hypothetical protein HYX69_09130 [Planctomycetia bacterium]|nr:hypothetical protein [Planctomycetia bacterium]
MHSDNRPDSPSLETQLAEAEKRVDANRRFARWSAVFAGVLIACLFLPAARGVVMALVTLPERLLVELEVITGVGMRAALQPSPLRALAAATVVVIIVAALLHLRGGARPDSAPKA